MQRNITYSWEKIDSNHSKTRPTSREGFIFEYLSDKSLYLLFGGTSNHRHNDLFTFSTATKEWNEQETSGEIPRELSYSAGWYDAPFLFLNSGKNKQTALSDTYFLDTDTWIWRKVFTLEQPSPRYYHQVVRGNSREAFLFGGFNTKRNKCLNDLFRYDYGNLQFNSKDKDKVGGSGWTRLSPSVLL